jgi:[protein-PII] uridylyltransferase
VTDARGGSEAVRAARDALVADDTLRGVQFGAALADVLDRTLLDHLHPSADVVVLALGSYARRELCPGSDVDVLLLHRGKGASIAPIADALWYPLWDAGFVLGHATRTAKECRKLADGDLDTLTSLLDARIVCGQRLDEAHRLLDDIRKLARKRRDALVGELADAAMVRKVKPGPIAEMLAPNLKNGAGGLRDLQALAWVGWCVSHLGGWDGLVGTGVLSAADAEFLAYARDTLLDTRVELHRATGGRTDLLALEDQDVVARRRGDADADALVRDLAAFARRVTWIADEAWNALRPRNDGPPVPDADLGHGARMRAGRVTVTPGEMDGATLLRVASAAATADVPIARDALTVLRDAPAPEWDDRTRDDLVAWLRAGPPTLDVFAALDHEDLVTRILPEWANVRFLPQRNAYHRFTVDRHLIEAVMEAARLLDRPEGPAERPASVLERPDLLLLAALLHDVAKGLEGDHSEIGEAWTTTIAARFGFAPDDVADLAWLVRDHLYMADVATRRDLADPVTVNRFADRVRTPQRLALLTLLTIADSRATGPAAWSGVKGALIQELYERTAAHFAGEQPAPTFGAARVELDALAGSGVVVNWREIGHGRWRCSVGAPDRPGLLADVAGALSLVGFDIDRAEGHSLSDRRAAEVFDGTDRFERLATDAGRERAASTIRGVLAGEVSVADGLRERRAAYGQRPPADDRIEIGIAPMESAESTVVEVFAPDAIGLLADIAGVFGALGLDVRIAKVATAGELAVDVFYVRDGDRKLLHPARIAELRARLRTVLLAD